MPAGVACCELIPISRDFYHRANLLSLISFGWDSGLIGGILQRPAFKNAFGLTNNALAWANISGWIVSVLQAGCFFVSDCSFSFLS